ncbi:MAG: aminoacyl-tRNA hydrolase [Candidatus Omnitrophica bacterium]|nr:aminoacyl-tRNA hydrolase [Candidatus Omnitrophota bacterium]
MKLIVGLGNPGFKYRNTKHNMGFWVIDRIAKEKKIALTRRKFNAQWGESRYGQNEKFIIAKPLTFMNLSGQAVCKLIDYFKLQYEDILVIIDDIDLDVGTIRIKPNGTAGGHNGLASVLECVGSRDLARLRIGIKNGERAADLSGFVLTPFRKKEDSNLIKKAVHEASCAALCWLEKGIIFTMNNFNKKKEDC